MGLVLFALLFLFGATGMERRRGVVFSLITSALLFAWVLPLVIHENQSFGVVSILISAIGLLIAAVLTPIAFYFAGQIVRGIFTRLTSSRET